MNATNNNKEITKETLIKFVRNENFAYCVNAGRMVCCTGHNNHEEEVEYLVKEYIEEAPYIEIETDEIVLEEFEEDIKEGCTIYKAGYIYIAYFD